MASLPELQSQYQTASDFISSIRAPCDFVINVGDPIHFSFNVHRDVVSVQSAYFRNLCTLPFMDTNEGYVTFPEEDPTYVARMIIFFYMRTYHTEFSALCWTESSRRAVPVFHGPGRYCWSAEYLVMLAREAVVQEDSDNVMTAIRRVEEGRDKAEVSLQMYALAERYGIEAMKLFTLDEIRLGWDSYHPWNLVDLLQGIEVFDGRLLIQAVCQTHRQHQSHDMDITEDLREELSLESYPCWTSRSFLVGGVRCHIHTVTCYSLSNQRLGLQPLVRRFSFVADLGFQ